MIENRSIVGKGMFYMFVGAIISIFSIIPFIGWIVALISMIVSAYGLMLAGKVHEKFKLAFYCTIADLVLAILGTFFLGSFFGIVRTVIFLVIVYLVCIASSELLRGLDDKLADNGFIWKFNAGCALAAVLCGILALISTFFAVCIGTLVAVFQLLASIIYITFLYQAQKVLQAAQ